MKSLGLMVWDPIVRLTHALVAGLVAWNWWDDSGAAVHRLLGYIALGLVLVRVVWGFIGTRAARFQTWWPHTARLRRHWRSMRRTAPAKTYPSHTPFGSLNMLLMWLCIFGLAATGFVSRLDAYWGEDGPIDLHRYLSRTLMGLVICHVLTALWSSWRGPVNLIAAMVTGRKRRRRNR
ncbi:MAG: cytochrome b/b6 domain-containing protein [Burkholderiaceae bacterium]|jgi:cytochrome b